MAKRVAWSQIDELPGVRIECSVGTVSIRWVTEFLVGAVRKRSPLQHDLSLHGACNEPQTMSGSGWKVL
jgi:hypothetical protein